MMATAAPSPSRDRILEAIRTFHATYGHPPSVRDLVRVTGLRSTGTVAHHLRMLVEDGSVIPCGCGCGRAYPVRRDP